MHIEVFICKLFHVLMIAHVFPQRSRHPVTCFPFSGTPSTPTRVAACGKLRDMAYCEDSTKVQKDSLGSCSIGLVVQET